MCWKHWQWLEKIEKTCLEVIHPHTWIAPKTVSGYGHELKNPWHWTLGRALSPNRSVVGFFMFIYHEPIRDIGVLFANLVNWGTTPPCMTLYDKYVRYLHWMKSGNQLRPALSFRYLRWPPFIFWLRPSRKNRLDLMIGSQTHSGWFLFSAADTSCWWISCFTLGWILFFVGPFHSCSLINSEFRFANLHRFTTFVSKLWIMIDDFPNVCWQTHHFLWNMNTYKYEYTHVWYRYIYIWSIYIYIYVCDFFYIHM